MPERDSAIQPLHDLLSAFGLLTRLPLPQTSRHRADAAWCWPLVGLCTGALSLAMSMALIWLGISTAVAAASYLAAHLLMTGALHEDGLADTADGLFGGWTPERRLDIMKDSHIGSYGTLALIVVSLAQWSALASLLANGMGAAILAAASLSRVPMAAIMATLPNARKSGLSSTVGRPGRGVTGLAALLGGLIALAVTRDALLIGKMAVVMGAVGLGVATLARRKIGGQTGDILGASQVLCFVSGLVVAQT